MELKGINSFYLKFACKMTCVNCHKSWWRNLNVSEVVFDKIVKKIIIFVYSLYNIEARHTLDKFRQNPENRSIQNFTQFLPYSRR